MSVTASHEVREAYLGMVKLIQSFTLSWTVVGKIEQRASKGEKKQTVSSISSSHSFFIVSCTEAMCRFA
jgi:hypothetical protein